MLAARHTRLALSRATVNNLTLGQGSKIISVGPTQIQVATLLPTHGEKFPYHPKPFPYEKKRYTLWGELFDVNWRTRKTENSKVICVEGNVGVGKNKFAERLADEFDLKFFPSTPESEAFVHNNYDIRNLDDMLPDGAKAYDLKRWLSDPNPKSGKVAKLQYHWYIGKCGTYFAALNHLLQTGQGVVVVKSPFSDNVFVEALRRMGWMSKAFASYHAEVHRATLATMLPPHLTLYLDAPIKTLRERIQARNDPREKNAPNLTDKLLQMVDTMYKQVHLPEMSKTGEVLELDWEVEADDLDMDTIAEDISHLHLESLDNEDTKFQTWYEMDLDQNTTVDNRLVFQDPSTLERILWSNGTPWNCPEMLMDPDSAVAFEKVVVRHPALWYQENWAPQLGNEPYLRFV